MVDTHSKSDDKDAPPMKLFVICNKTHSEEDLRRGFQKYGKIEDIVLKEITRSGKGNKRLAYIEFSKTSEAALALEEMDGKCLADVERPLKVSVAVEAKQGVLKAGQDGSPDKYTKLCLTVPKDMTEESLKAEFEKYGPVDNVQIVPDKTTQEPEGVAYIKFQRFYSAAVAYENCPATYKAVFVSPKPIAESLSQSTGRYDDESSSPLPSKPNVSSLKTGSSRGQPSVLDVVCSNEVNRDNWSAVAFEKCPATNKAVFASAKPIAESSSQSIVSSLVPSQSNTSSLGSMGSSHGQPSALDVICSNEVNRDQLWRLFDLVPGLDYCQINGEDGPNCKATVVYTNKDSAEYARKNMNEVEFPLGHNIFVKYADGTILDTQLKPKTNRGKQKQLLKTVKLYKELLDTRLTVEEKEKYTIGLNKIKNNLNRLKKQKKII